MKQIKLSGREAAVIRAVGFGLPVHGLDISEYTKLSDEDLADVLNAMMDVGYIESSPTSDRTDVSMLATTEFEVNSAYVHELKAALNLIRR